jgi:hypothetical protein
MAGEWQVVQLIWYLRAKAGMALQYIPGRRKFTTRSEINNFAVFIGENLKIRSFSTISTMPILPQKHKGTKLH